MRSFLQSRVLRPAPLAAAALALSLSMVGGCGSWLDPNRSWLDPGEMTRVGGETLYQNIL